LLLRAKRPSFAKANSGQAYGPGRPSPPIWPCSTRGFPCPGCCHPGGGLLPHLFTLAKCARPKEAGFRFFRKPAAEAQASPAVSFSVALSVAAPPNAFALCDATPWRYQARCPAVAGSCEFATAGVRTFLPPIPLARSGPAITRLTRHQHYSSKSSSGFLAIRAATRALFSMRSGHFYSPSLAIRMSFTSRGSSGRAATSPALATIQVFKEHPTFVKKVELQHRVQTLRERSRAQGVVGVDF
jgi:hypothetical protein